jgi:predicted DNA-binding transcriptional regulator AlpA
MGACFQATCNAWSNPLMDSLENLLDEIAISKIFGRAIQTLQKDRLSGEGPPFIKIGRLVRYRPSDVQAWLDQQTRRSTTDQGAAHPTSGARDPLTAQNKTRRAGGAAGLRSAVSLAGNDHQNNLSGRLPQAKTGCADEL